MRRGLVSGRGFRGNRILSKPQFSPLSLFSSSEPGAWYDPSDISTLFQDTAGTTPVTAAGQSVARINDKSGRGNHATQATAGSRPTYQVDGNGRGHLSFDGTDDFLASGTITPGTNKVQIFAGIRKLSDAATAVLAETGPNSSTNTGTLGLFAPITAATGDYAARSRGSVASTATTANAFAAPVTSVLAMTADIAADSVVLRVNGVQAATSSADQGTGNFQAQPLYIGRRAGTTFPFNGRFYGLILRFGATLTAPQISQVETWMNGKTGAY